MKRFLVAFLAITSLGFAATAANAQSAASRHKECDNTSSCDQEIEFKGKITPSCSCDSDDGKLPTKGLTNQLLSSDGGGAAGKFTATCNTTTAKVTYSRLSFIKPGAQASVGEYAVVGPTPGPTDDVPFTAAPATRSWPTYTPKTAIISARVTAPVGEMLQAGDYAIVVKASVTP
jgi:hypothetical protein